MLASSHVVTWPMPVDNDKEKNMNVKVTVTNDDKPDLPVREPGQNGEDIGGSGSPMERQPVPWAK